MGGLLVAYQDRSTCHSGTCGGCLVRLGVWGTRFLERGLHFTGFRADVGEGVWRRISLFVLRLVTLYCNVFLAGCIPCRLTQDVGQVRRWDVLGLVVAAVNALFVVPGGSATELIPSK